MLFANILPKKISLLKYTTSIWYGVTYREDANTVRQALKELVDNGEYPANLWK